MENMSEKRARKKPSRYVKEGHYTAFNSIRQVLHLASAIAYGTTGMPQIEWLDDDHRKASINGKAVELEDIGKFVFERLKAAKIILEKEVMFGHDFEEFGFTSAKVMDALRNRKIKYSFIDNAENGFVKFKDKLFQTLLNDPLIGPQFVKHVRGGRVEWNKDGCMRWLKRTKAFLETMMVVIHISYGQPARAEELGTVMIKNHINAMRGIYWSRGQVMMAISYNKTRSTNEKDKVIARFLPEEVGDLMIKYLSLVRPLKGFIAEQMECERFENYEKLLFTDYERDWNEKRLSEIFKREMNEWGPVSMGFQEYRQLANLWMRRHLKRVELEEDLRDHQSGHNSETAGARYGITSEDMNELTPEKLLAFFYASQEWHRLLGFKSNKRDNVKEKEKENPGKRKQKEQDEEGMMKWRKRMEAGLLKERPYRVQSRISASQPLPASHSNSNVSVSGRLLRGLRQFQNDDKARFKSPEQGKALQLVIDGKKDVLAILPTGGGKSLLFFLPTMMEPGMT
ncbi:MAG: hypothetical protein E6J34_15325, partial [Chloroflexi bacterium]